jgi:catechol 1,2-dioxygenase
MDEAAAHDEDLEMTRIPRRDLLQGLGLAGLLAACGNERGAPGAPDAGDSGSSMPDPDAGDGALEDAAADAATADAGHDHAACRPTSGDVEGPFYRAGAPSRTALVGADEPGEKLLLTGNVLDADCSTPIRGALLDVWQADAAGNYDNLSADYRLRAVMASDDGGEFGFETIRPGNYPDAGGMRPAHIHFTVVHPDYPSLTTQLYFAGDPFLAPNDSCAVCSSGDPTLIITLERELREGVEWLVGHFDIVLRR